MTVSSGPGAMKPLRDQPRLPWFDDLTRDVGYGARMLGRRPGFALTAILSLALGIGASTGIFSLVDQVLLRMLPVREPTRLVLLDWNGNSLADRWTTNMLSYPFCRELQQEDHFFEGVFCRGVATVNFSTGRWRRSVAAEIVSGSYFLVLGVRPEFGRLIHESDDLRPGDHPVVVLSYEYWRNSLGASPDVVGSRVLVNNNPMTVVGVAQAGFNGVDVGQRPALWIPTMMADQAILESGRLLDSRTQWLHVFGRLKADVTAEEAEAGLQPWFQSMLDADRRHERFPRVNPEARRAYMVSTLDVLPAAQGWSGLRRALERPLWVLMAGTTLLLLLSCLNVANLLLARRAERNQEVTTRMALGATRSRIARQLLAEALLIALGGGLLGLLLAPAVSRVLILFLPPNADLMPRMDARILLFALLMSVLTGVLSGLAPALHAARGSLAASIQGRATGNGRVRFRKSIVVTQLALTLVLLVGAGLFVQTLVRLYARDRGFNSQTLLMFRADPAAAGHSEADAARVMREIHRRVQELNTVQAVALANNSLLAGVGPSRSLTVESDRRLVAEGVPMMRASAGFFRTLGARVVAGREFDENDVREVEKTGPRSAIVNESFAKRYFGGPAVVGRRLGIGTRPDTPTNIEIVGVVSDFSRRFLREDQRPDHLFLPFAQDGPGAGDGTFYVRVHGEPGDAVPSIRDAVADAAPMLPLVDPIGVEEHIARALRSERMLAILSSGFGLAALLLSVVGLYGLMSFVVTQRTQEIGVRMALGATRGAAAWLVIRDTLVMMATGIAIGVPAALALRRLVEAQLYGVGAFDAPTIAAASGGLMTVALGATMLPAWRAAVVPPMVAIREQPESLWQTARQRVRQAIQDLSTPSERSSRPSITLISEFTGLVQRANSYSEAVPVAVTALRDRMGVQLVLLLEKASNDEYRSGTCSIPANGFLINRLTHYPHPLPLTPGDFQAWLRWAAAFRPNQVAEIETLRDSGARMAVALRTRHQIVGVLLLGPPNGRDHFTDVEKQVSSSAAEVFALMIENARLTVRALEQEKIRRDLALAAEVQRRLLPPRPPACPGITLAAFSLPARAVGGDFYDFVDLPGGRIGIAVADIAGKGIPAALLTSAVQASLRLISADGDVAPAQLAAKMNNFLCRSTASNNYATFFYALLDPNGRRLRYVNAGHNPPYLLRHAGTSLEVMSLRVGGTVLGFFPDVDYEEAAIELRPGDLFVVFTDGVPEARNIQGEEFGEERLVELLRCQGDAPAQDVSAILAERMREWIAGAEQHDDLTFVVAACKLPLAQV